MRLALALLLMLVAVAGNSQTTEEAANGTGQPNYHDVAGSALLLRDWMPGVIKFSSGRVTNQFKLRFDCVANKILLQFNGSSYATESKIREFVIYPKGFTASDSMVFRRNFPNTDIANEETYYQVLLEDTVMLLKLLVKNINEEKQLTSNIVYRRLKDEEKYYFLENGRLQLIPAEKAGVAEAFGEKKELIGKFIESKQLKFRNQNDYIEILKYYNSL